MEDLPFSSLIGSLNFAAVVCWPDIADCVGQYSRALQTPRKAIWDQAICTLRYLKGTASKGCVYCQDAGLQPVVYSDASFQQCPETSRSTTGFIVIMAGGPISWRSHRQHTVDNLVWGSVGLCNWTPGCVVFSGVVYFSHL